MAGLKHAIWPKGSERGAHLSGLTLPDDNKTINRPRFASGLDKSAWFRYKQTINLSEFLDGWPTARLFCYPDSEEI